METTQAISPKSGLITFILCLFLGGLGIHRFYVGKIGTGILMLITLGGLGFWILYDLFSIVCKTFTDKQGRLVEVTKNPNAPRNVVITVLCLSIIFFGLVFACAGVALRGISAVGKNEIAALRQGNTELAYSYTSIEFQKGVSLPTFKKFVNHFPQLHDNVDSTFTSVDFKDNDATILGKLTLKDGSSFPIQVNLVKEGDEWKVNEFNFDIHKSEAGTSPADQKAQ